jgi:1,4-dihydroxy-6-naphthoate synthase
VFPACFTFAEVNPDTLKIAFSPCPNDTFIFDGLVNQRIQDNIPLQFSLLDIGQLNQAAVGSGFDVLKISCAMYPFVAAEYEILSSGGALGFNCGPLLISLPGNSMESIQSGNIAIPGMHTTANLLLSILHPEIRSKRVMLFSEIEDAVLEKKVSAGVIIHENRFTYASKGLMKLADLGFEWQQLTGFPIPLGCIVVRRTLPLNVKIQIQSAIAASVRLAFANPELSNDFVAANAQEMDPEVQKQHIALYVNAFSEDMGDKGKAALIYLLQKGRESGLMPAVTDSVFLNDSMHIV